MMSLKLSYLSLLLVIYIITTIAHSYDHDHTCDSPFTFEGTYNLRIGAETRRLSVCETDTGVIFWGLSKIRSGEAKADTINYVYAVGRDESGMEKIVGAHGKWCMYEAESDSFWLPEEDEGTQLIQYFLRYDPNEKLSNQRYSLSLAKTTDDPDSIDSTYYLEKISDEVLGECFEYGDLTFDDIDYPTTYRSGDLSHTGFCRDSECNLILIETDVDNVCQGFYEPETNEFFAVAELDPEVEIEYQWGRKLRIGVEKWIWDGPNCPRFSILNVAEFYGDGANSYLVTGKCIESNDGGLIRVDQIDNIFGEDCPQLGPVIPDDICMLPKDEGTCSDFSKRFYYDKNKGRCKPFQYGGCGGNENRFETRKDCHKACKYKYN